MVVSVHWEEWFAQGPCESNLAILQRYMQGPAKRQRMAPIELPRPSQDPAPAMAKAQKPVRTKFSSLLVEDALQAS